MTKQQVIQAISDIGILPAVRVSTSADALFAAQAVFDGGIPLVEIPVTVPNATDLIAQLVKQYPGKIVGAGTVLDVETARRCLGAGAGFLTSTGLDLSVVELAAKEEIAVLPGALTPTEIIAAWKAGADLVKVFPCTQMGGDAYIRTLKTALPQIHLIAAGGVRQHTAGSFIQAGATAIGVGKELITQDAIEQHKAHWIHELAHRFLSLVKNARHPGEQHQNVVTFR